MQSLVHSAKSAFRLDFSNVERGFALRCSIGIAIPLVAAVALGKPQLGVSAALGALSTGFASLQGVYRTRAAAMLATACGMSLSMLAGGYAVHATLAIVAAAALWGYAYGLLSSLGNAAAAVGLNSVVALVIADAFAGTSISGVPLQALLVLAGGLEQTLLLVVLWPIRRYAAERHALGDAYRALGGFAREICAIAVAAPHPGAIAGALTTLADPAPFARRGDIAAFQALLDEAERIRAGLGALVTERYRYERRNDVARVHSVRAFGEGVAPALDELANALHEARAPVVDERLWVAVERDAVALDAPAQALLGQLRTAFRLASAPASERGAGLPPVRRRTTFPPVAQHWLTLRSNLSLASPYGRHAARLAFALGAAMLLARSGPFGRGYWIPMTVALVLRPDFRTTFTRGIARIAGTLFGAVLATAIVASVPASMHVDAALAVAFAALGYFVFGLNYAAYSATVTAYVVFLLALAGSVPEHAAVLQRTLATLAGAGLAAAVYVAWPTWESTRARTMLAAQLCAYHRYAQAIFVSYIEPSKASGVHMHQLQRAAWQARSMAEASIDTMIAEPKRRRAIETRIALGVLAAMQRIGVALLALGAQAARVHPHPEIATFEQGLDRAWDHCIALLHGDIPAEPMPPLRELYRDLEQRLGGKAEDAEAEIIFAESDLIVDGLNTIAALLAAQRPSQT